MAKNSSINVIGVRPSSVAMFEGTFLGAIGFVIAIMYSLNRTFELTESTNSVLAGLALGMAAGVVSIIVLPLIYFGIGWIVGYIHGWIFNAIAGGSGGIDLKVSD